MWSRNFHIHVCLPFSNLWWGRSVVGLLPSQKWICFVPFQVHPRFYVRTDVLMLIMLDCLRVALQVNKLKRTKENSKGENLKTKQTEKAEKIIFFRGDCCETFNIFCCVNHSSTCLGKKRTQIELLFENCTIYMLVALWMFPACSILVCKQWVSMDSDTQCLQTSLLIVKFCQSQNYKNLLFRRPISFWLAHLWQQVT